MREQSGYARPLAGQIYAQLKRAILRLEMRPGDQLQELELAAQYGGSRTPTREALMRLIQEQLVARLGRRYVVRTFSADEITHLYEMREALETMTVRLATSRATDAELTALLDRAEALAPAIAVNDVVSFHELDEGFHVSIAELGRNPLLTKEIRRLLELARLVFGQFNRQIDEDRVMQETLTEHRRIVDAMQRRNALIAEEEMRQKFRRVIDLYVAPK